MGACFRKLLSGKRYKDEPLNPKASAVVPACTSPPHNDGGAKARVQLFGDHLCPFTLRVRIALQHKGVLVDSTWLAPTDLTTCKFEGICPDGKLPVLQHGTHKLNGSTDSMLNYIEDAFSHPTLLAVGKTLLERAPPPITVMTVLQHRSILWQLDRLVQLADMLAVAKAEIRAGGSKRQGNTQMQSLWKGYGCLLELMQEHAQMEERVVFPALEVAAEGVSEAVLGDHARDLPVMNGIRADMKGVMVMEQGSTDHLEALLALALRLRTLQAYSVEHYHEEERELLPMLEGAGIGSKQQETLIGQCLTVMEASHAHLLPFLFQGLCPHEIHQYLGAMQSSSKEENSKILERVLQVMSLASEEFEGLKKVVQERVTALAAMT
ncbi:unnamed protein product [Sphagnum troendelagicum]|uniref:GST N-terminal domain-containing protein n=1 Tax=Sphagnum troendelagicum TaxID=128251 RepID=A0ABP0TVV4_9BRYO